MSQVSALLASKITPKEPSPIMLSHLHFTLSTLTLRMTNILVRIPPSKIVGSGDAVEAKPLFIRISCVRTPVL
jgi:hypothetical protein